MENPEHYVSLSEKELGTVGNSVEATHNNVLRGIGYGILALIAVAKEELKGEQEKPVVKD